MHFSLEIQPKCKISRIAKLFKLKTMQDFKNYTTKQCAKLKRKNKRSKNQFLWKPKVCSIPKKYDFCTIASLRTQTETITKPISAKIFTHDEVTQKIILVCHKNLFIFWSSYLFFWKNNNLLYGKPTFDVFRNQGVGDAGVWRNRNLWHLQDCPLNRSSSKLSDAFCGRFS